MFKYSLDQKNTITDNNGNEIVDLASSMFRKDAGIPANYEIKSVTETYNMRPDLVAVGEYGTDEGTEMILKYSGISNPFSFGENDIIMIPVYADVMNSMKAEVPEDEDLKEQNEILIRNYFKFNNPDAYKTDTTSYDALNNLNIPSGAISKSETTNSEYSVPYISADGTTAVTIANGKIYFGTNSGVTSANEVVQINSAQSINEKVRSIINNTAQAMNNTNCLYNGTDTGTLIRSQIIKNNS